ncbi:discoidin domain-containing protein [Fodinicola acaciae]|uniref:discoidin domain-containing protein n=1 Tax=Fodinicola acaciae TaxID=2681555 RepID=UPI0013D2F6AB|nr:discoidin domain-containing protein [Fodinicola acaciae]
MRWLIPALAVLLVSGMVTNPAPSAAAPAGRLTGSATASSVAGPDFVADKVIDDDPRTGWQAGAGGSQWLRVDLGWPYALTSVRQTFGAIDLWTFTVSGSLNGSDWVTLMDRSTGLAGQTFATSVSGTYRYVRLTVTGAKHGHPPSSNDFVLTGSREADIAAGRPVATSSNISGYEGGHAVDGDTSTYWCAGSGSLPQWLQVDLGAPTAITGVEQDFKDYDHVAFVIEASNDPDANYVALVDHRSDNSYGQSFRDAVSGTYRFVRLTVTGTEHGHWAGSTGFKVFAPIHDNPAPRDLAVGAVATSSSLSVGYEPWHALDASTGHSWIAADPGSTFGVGPQKLTVDLGNASRLTGIEQAFLDNDTWHFVLDGSLDGTTWQRLVDHGSGAAGQVFSDQVSGTYRYVRLTIAGPSDSGKHWPCSQELKIFGFGSPVANRRWVEHSGPVMRYYPKHYGTKLTTIIGQLDGLQEQGYQAIEVAAPYAGPRTPWAGLGATDNYAIDPSIGTMADFEQLIREVHSRGMKISMFGNVGYASPQAPFWLTAQDDPNSAERKWFDIVPADGPASCDETAHRWWSDRAHGCYFAFWTDPADANAHMPSYNFANQEWRDEASRYLAFWMNKGLDGFGMDAPRAYLNINDDISNRYLTNVLNNYNAWTLPEGLQASADGPGDLLNGVPGLHYNTIQDLYVSWWGCADPCSRIVPAIRNGDPSQLEDFFKASRDAINQQGGVTMSMPSWDSDINQSDGSTVPDRVQPADVRLLEMATIATMGAQFYLHNGNHMYLPQERTIPTWTADQQAMVGKLLRAQSDYPALDPRGLRCRLPLGTDDSRAYAYLRTDKTGGVRAIVVLNFQNAPLTVKVPVGNAGIAIGQTPVDLMENTPAPPITSSDYTVSLPARGFTILAVR